MKLLKVCTLKNGFNSYYYIPLKSFEIVFNRKEYTGT